MSGYLRFAASWGLVGFWIVAGLTGWLAPEGMPEPAWVAWAILLVAATLWITEVVPLFVTSFVVLLLSHVWLIPELQAAGWEGSADRFSGAFASDIIVLFLGGFVLAAGLQKYRYDVQLAHWVIRRTGTRFVWFMLGIMLLTAGCSMWLSNTATTALMLALLVPVLDRLAAGDRGRQALLLSVPFAANIGGVGSPIGSPPNAIALQYLRQAGVALPFDQWLLIGVPGSLVLVVIAWGILLKVHPPQAVSVSLAPLQGSGEPSAGGRVVLWGTLLTILGWATGTWHGQPAAMVATLPIILFFGTGSLSLDDLRRLPWDVLLLMGGGLCLGVGLSTSGLADWFAAQMPWEGIGTYGMMVAVAGAACLLSAIMSNTAAANLLMPVALGLAGSGSPRPLLLAIAFACSLAMPLPVSTPPNAMAFAHGGLSVRDLLIPGILVTVSGLLFTFTVGYWWWQVVGVIP
jgi:solute carrier family 13 (sodium-dependent dicarboxylate transporter), member 2/3/5